MAKKMMDGAKSIPAHRWIWRTIRMRAAWPEAAFFAGLGDPDTMFVS